MAAYFDKSGSDDSALTFSPKWQRRFFIFSDSQRMLYYFKVGGEGGGGGRRMLDYMKAGGQGGALYGEDRHLVQYQPRTLALAEPHTLWVPRRCARSQRTAWPCIPSSPFPAITPTPHFSPSPLLQSPDDVPKANGLRGQVNIAECYIDDLDERGNPRGAGSPQPSSTDKAHWTMRIRHKDPRQMAVKEHNSIVLRAETFQVGGGRERGGGGGQRRYRWGEGTGMFQVGGGQGQRHHYRWGEGRAEEVKRGGDRGHSSRGSLEMAAISLQRLHYCATFAAVNTATVNSNAAGGAMRSLAPFLLSSVLGQICLVHLPLSHPCLHPSTPSPLTGQG